MEPSVKTGPHPPDRNRPWLACAPFEELLEMAVVSVGDGRAVMTMPFLSQFAQGTGLLHGGALVALADTAMAMAVKSVVPADTRVATVDMQTRFLAPVTEGVVTASACIDHARGRRLNGHARVTSDTGVSVMFFSAAFQLSQKERVPANGPWAAPDLPPGIPPIANLFAGRSHLPSEERVEVLARSGSIRVERILSRGHQSPDAFWYDQPETEWVALLNGRAVLEFETPPGTVTLTPGDWLSIPAGCRHRVAMTEPDTETVWLAVFYPNDPVADR